MYKKARAELLNLQKDEKFKKLYDARLNSLKTENSVLIHERKEGRKEERKEGLEIEKRRNDIRMTFYRLKFKVNLPVRENSKISEQDIKFIDEFLKEQNCSVKN